MCFGKLGRGFPHDSNANTQMTVACLLKRDFSFCLGISWEFFSMTSASALTILPIRQWVLHSLAALPVILNSPRQRHDSASWLCTFL